MRASTRQVAAALCLACAAQSVSAGTQGPLQHWPESAAQRLNSLIAKNANQSNYAVFDLDNTSWRWDVEESSLPYLENLGIITRDTLDPSLKLIDFKDTTNYTETLYSYYNRLCDISDFVCYPWAAQVYAGLTLRELKGYIDDLMALNTTIPTSYWDDDVVVQTEINPPQIFQGQLELYNALMNNGIDVYPVSASNEEVVRMIMSDPKYGYNIPPEKVIGVSSFLVNTTSGDLTNSRLQIEAGTYDMDANMDLVISAYYNSPATWYAGKWAACLTYIDMYKKPILAAGDTPGSDTFMHFNVDLDKDGVRLWVNRSAEKYEQLWTIIDDNVADQESLGMEVDADKNWLFVLPTDIL